MIVFWTVMLFEYEISIALIDGVPIETWSTMPFFGVAQPKSVVTGPLSPGVCECVAGSSFRHSPPGVRLGPDRDSSGASP